MWTLRVVCLSVCLCPINVKTAEPINPKFVWPLTWSPWRFKNEKFFTENFDDTRFIWKCANFSKATSKIRFSQLVKQQVTEKNVTQRGKRLESLGFLNCKVIKRKKGNYPESKLRSIFYKPPSDFFQAVRWRLVKYC